MAVAFQDYYETLGVGRDATPEQVQSAYRKKARKHHPDVNKASDSEEIFKLINEAYEVLRDPEKRRLYNRLGRDWKAGQSYTPPPGGSRPGAGQGRAADGRGERTVSPDDYVGYGGEYSDFFESLFGAGAARQRGPHRGQDIEGEITIGLDEAYRGATRAITLRQSERAGDGSEKEVSHDYEVRIPPGTLDGARLRLAGQGQAGAEGGQAGDLYIRVRIAPHPLFRLDGHDVETDLPVAPWEAALGAEVPVPTLDGPVQTKVPAGTSCGKRLRLRGLGWPDRNGQRGDLYARIRIDVPRTLSDRERTLFEDLRSASTFSPRASTER